MLMEPSFGTSAGRSVGTSANLLPSQMIVTPLYRIAVCTLYCTSRSKSVSPHDFSCSLCKKSSAFLGPLLFQFCRRGIHPPHFTAARTPVRPSASLTYHQTRCLLSPTVCICVCRGRRRVPHAECRENFFSLSSPLLFLPLRMPEKVEK